MARRRRGNRTASALVRGVLAEEHDRCLPALEQKRAQRRLLFPLPGDEQPLGLLEGRRQVAPQAPQPQHGKLGVKRSVATDRFGASCAFVAGFQRPYRPQTTAGTWPGRKRKQEKSYQPRYSLLLPRIVGVLRALGIGSSDETKRPRKALSANTWTDRADR
jgi:hypothetical protein